LGSLIRGEWTRPQILDLYVVRQTKIQLRRWTGQGEADAAITAGRVSVH
jgi:hypothetical protein